MNVLTNIKVHKDNYTLSKRNKVHLFNNSNFLKNLVTLETNIVNLINLLINYIDDIEKLNKSIDENGFDSSYESFKNVIHYLIKNFNINCTMALSNYSSIFNFKLIQNQNKIALIKKTINSSNYELDKKSILVSADNNLLNYLHFSNLNENEIQIIVGNNNSSFNINSGDVILVKNTKNYNGFYKCKNILQN